MPPVLPRFCAIIERSLRPELGLDELAHVLIRAGVRLIQLRDKPFGFASLGYARDLRRGLRQGGQATSPSFVGTSPSFVGTSQALLSQARQLLALLPRESRLVVNDRADVARLAGAAGVHLGQDDLPPAAARELLGPESLIGWSTHRPEQVERGDSLPVDYLAFGPVFPTATKKDARPVVGCAGLREVRRLTRKPLVAIGGITPDNAAEAIAAGADCVAVISGWLVPTKEGLAAPDIPARLEEFRRALGRLD
ncbi:MAG: thiamine phosphate synthase [Candidatus Acidoferrales bacterium]